MLKLSHLVVTTDDDHNVYVSLKGQPTFTTRVMVPGGADVQHIIDTAEKHFDGATIADLYVATREAVTKANSALAGGLSNAQRPDSVTTFRVAATVLQDFADAIDA